MERIEIVVKAGQPPGVGTVGSPVSFGVYFWCLSLAHLDLDHGVWVPASDGHGHPTSQDRQPVSFLERYRASPVR